MSDYWLRGVVCFERLCNFLQETLGHCQVYLQVSWQLYVAFCFIYSLSELLSVLLLCDAEQLKSGALHLRFGPAPWCYCQLLTGVTFQSPGSSFSQFSCFMPTQLQSAAALPQSVQSLRLVWLQLPGWLIWPTSGLSSMLLCTETNNHYSALCPSHPTGIFPATVVAADQTNANSMLCKQAMFTCAIVLLVMHAPVLSQSLPVGIHKITFDSIEYDIKPDEWAKHAKPAFFEVRQLRRSMMQRPGQSSVCVEPALMMARL